MTITFSVWYKAVTQRLISSTVSVSDSSNWRWGRVQVGSCYFRLREVQVRVKD